MDLNKIEASGKRAWYDGVGFLDNPYHVWYQEEQFVAWNRGWFAVNREMEEKDRKILHEELEREAEIELAAQIEKEKKKTKKGRAELAGQTTLF